MARPPQEIRAPIISDIAANSQEGDYLVRRGFLPGLRSCCRYAITALGRTSQS
jgi:hypothetical protein